MGSSILNKLEWLSALILEWTPLSMLVTYCIFSYFLYILLPHGITNVIYYLLLSLQTFVTVSVMFEAISCIRPSVEARRERRKAARDGFPDLEEERKCPYIDLVMVAYLPNEADIILRQVRYALKEIRYPKRRYTVNVVYNTPRPVEPVESQLRAMEAEYPHLRVIKVEGSTSKADNVNHFLAIPSKAGRASDIIAIYDTDHYPHQDALRFAARRLNKGDVSVVQGRCTIYNSKETWVTALLAAEFDNIYGVFHPGRSELVGQGIFGGSNGFWSASLLRALGFQKHMLTEDIDSTMRALASGARIAYDLNVRSFETAPTTPATLLKQRLRWSQGWTQVSIRHLVRLSKHGASRAVGREFAGAVMLLGYREVHYYVPINLLALLLAYVTTSPPRSLHAFYSGMTGFSITLWLLALNVVAMLVVTLITLRNRGEFTSRGAVFAFGALSPIWFTLVALTAIFAQFREVIRYEKWNPTARSTPKKTT